MAEGLTTPAEENLGDWQPPGFEAPASTNPHNIKVGGSSRWEIDMSMYYIRTDKATEYAEFFSAPTSDLAANGLRMTADGDHLRFGQRVLNFLRGERTDRDDGYITDDETGPTMWIEGDGYPVIAE